MFRCPTCGSSSCITPALDVLARSSSLYTPCNSCVSDQPLDKQVPLRELGISLCAETGRCSFCGRRHIDLVMAQVLDILIDSGLKSEAAALKDVGTPLITFGVELLEPPRLGAGELIVVLDDVDQAAADRILAEVPEVKGVLKRSGGPKKGVGLADTGQEPHLYELLGGCDVRADLVNSLVGDFCLYRRQSRLHIEFWRNNSVKVKVLEKMFLDGELAGRTVVDGMASVGTLGLMAAAGGASRVILNDAWLPAVESLLVNLEANRDLLGVTLEILRPVASLPLIADEPVLVARASGSTEIEVWHSDLRKLAGAVKACDICIIDAFPGVPTDTFVGPWRGAVRGKIVTL